MSDMLYEARIAETMGKMRYYLSTHESIVVGVSGGSDSDIVVHIIATHFRDMLYKIKFVFINTGLEYEATKKHIDDLEQKYDIHINRIRGMSVVHAVKQFGVPVLSKDYSRKVYDYCRNLNYVKKWINKVDQYSYGKFKPSDKQLLLAKEIKARGILVSSKCCDASKKNPAHKFAKENKADLQITGERRSEGGIRAVSHKSCFQDKTDRRIAKYMPLFFWDDDIKQRYKEENGIKYSDCYEVWGFKRTGCVGCPFNSKASEELKVVKKYEPKLYNACINVFGDSYRLSDEFNLRKTKFFEPEIDNEQG